MSKSKVVFALVMVAFVAGCAAKQEEVVYVDDAAITADVADTGKYK